MIVRTQEIKQLEQLYGESGNQLVFLYGREGCGKEQLIRQLMQGKKVFYYRARQASAKEQILQMGAQIEKQYDIKIQKYTYDEYFTRVRSGDASKLLVVIDEFQNIVKKDESFLEAIKKLRGKRLYPGPVMILLCSSQVAWIQQDFKESLVNMGKQISAWIHLKDIGFLDVVRNFPEYDTRQCVVTYGILGGVPELLSRWNGKKGIKENICENILAPTGYLYGQAERYLATQLRELSLYSTILGAIASGKTKLNELYQYTDFSRAKISVYIKNLMAFQVVEKVVSFETGGWENAKKGIYRISDHFIHFWFHFIYPNLSQLYLLSEEEFYDRYIEPGLENYTSQYFVQVCEEFLKLMNQIGRLSLKPVKMGTWIGKEGTIDIIAQNEVRENLVGICNWSEPILTIQHYQKLEQTMKKAKIKAKYYFLFSAGGFDEELKTLASKDERYMLIDSKDL